MRAFEERGLVESTRRALERAAFDLISRQGFAATTAAEIAAEAGFTERTFFRYFDEKEDVVFSPLESLFDRYLPRLRERVLAEGPTVDALVEAFHDTNDADPDMQATILRNLELIRANPELERRLGYHRKWFTDRTTRALADILGQDTPSLEVRTTAAITVAILVSASQHWLNTKDPRSIRELTSDAREAAQAVLPMRENGAVP